MKPWHVVYGTILTGLVAGGVIASAMNSSLLSNQMITGFSDTFEYVLPILLGTIVLFSGIERILPAAGPRKPIKGYVLNIQVTLLNFSAAALSAGVVGAFTVALGSRLGLGWIDLRFSTGHGFGSLILVFLLSQLIADFFYYWMHRFQHESPLLWQEHKLHHMDEQLCALIREHPLEPVLETMAITIPMAIVFKLDPIEGTIISYIPVVWGVFIHSNIRVNFGWASAFFTSPQVHRIHHSRMPEHHDKNYAPVFSFWDVIFGTYHRPKRDEYPLTGVYDEREVENFTAAAILPFREWWKMLREWHSGHARRIT